MFGFYSGKHYRLEIGAMQREPGDTMKWRGMAQSWRGAGRIFASLRSLSTFLPMEIGIYSFAETRFDPSTGHQHDVDGRLRDLLEEIELADEVGLDVFGVGEHHRPDYAVSAPAVVLAAAATRTKRIRLTSAVSVLSSDEPVRVFQDFATLDQISGGRAEIMVGRGSFTESFPLFGQDLSDYEDLFSEKLDLLLEVREQERNHVVGPASAAHRGSCRISPPAPGSDTGLGRRRRNSPVGQARCHAGASHGTGHHRRRARALQDHGGSLPRGRGRSRARSGDASGEHQLPRIPRR